MKRPGCFAVIMRYWESGALAAMLALVAFLATAPVLANPSGGAAAGTWPPDAIIEQFETHFRITADGRLQSEHYRKIRLESPLAFNQLTDTRLAYDREFEELALDVARIVLPDGTAIDVPPRAIVVTTPRQVPGAASFYTFSEWVITAVGARVGATLELRWRVSDRVARRQHFEGLVVLGDRFPISKAVVTLELPASLSLSTLARRATGEAIGGGPTVQKAAMTLYSWQLENIPAVHVAADSTVMGHAIVLFSTANSWQQLFDPLMKRVDEAAPVVGRAVSRTTKDGAVVGAGAHGGAMETVAALAVRMRQMGHDVVPMSAAPRDLVTVWESRDATALEMALLTMAGLRSSGAEVWLEAFVPWIGAGKLSPEEIPPSMSLLSGLRVVVDDPSWRELRFAPFASLPDAMPACALGGYGLRASLGEGKAVTFGAVKRPCEVGGVDAATTISTGKGRVLVKVSARAWGVANHWFLMGGKFDEAKAKGMLGADFVLPGLQVKRVGVSSFSPLESVLEVHGELELPKAATFLADLSPFAAALDTLAGTLLEAGAVRCVGCSLSYKSVVQVADRSMVVTVGGKPSQCQSRTRCQQLTLSRDSEGLTIERFVWLVWNNGDEGSRNELARFRRANQSRSVMIYLPEEQK